MCDGKSERKVGCPKCIGTGKIWDMAAANRLAMESYDALHAALKIMIFESSIPESVATVSADGVRTLAPVFSFGDIRVAAIPARAATGISGLSIYSHDKRPIPFSSLLAAKNRDLVLIDLGLSSIVTPLELEANASNLDTGRHVYAYGTSRENDIALRLDGKILAAGSMHISSSIASKSLVDCAPLITDDGKLGGIFMYPMAEFNSSGAISLMQNEGSAMRLDNLLPSDFVRVTIGDLNNRNSAITFAMRAVKSAKEFLEMDNDALALRQSAISDTIKRLDRAVAMLKNVPRWELFMMEATAKELSGDCEVRARNLEARLAQMAKAEAEKRAAAQSDEDDGVTNAMEVVAAPKLDDESPAKPAKKTSGISGKKKRKAEEADGENTLNFNWRKIITISAIAIVAITAIFILMGVIQERNRKKKLAEPPKIPDFIREMKEYERKHPGKGK